MSIPQEFIEEIERYQCEYLNGLVDALEHTEPSVSVRANRGKGASPRHPGEVELVPWCGNAWYLARRESFTFDPAMHQGLYYVQDASSMILSHIVSHITHNAPTPLRYLDACAAPGGKTTAAIDALPAGSLVVANEYVPARATVLRENVIKWGSPFTVVTKGDTCRYRHLNSFFDIISADVPCSGEGMMRKDAEAVTQWSRGLIKECTQRQREIIDNLWPSLKPGGFLIYSTCTFNRNENEEMVDYICEGYGAESVCLDIPDKWNIMPGIDTTHHCYRFLPHKVKGEGLFIAVLRKPASDDCSHHKSTKMRKQPQPKPNPLTIQAGKWICGAADYNVTTDGDFINAFPKEYAHELTALKSHLDIIHYGVRIGAIKGRDLIPSQSLALSLALNRDAFAPHEVNYETAIAYLRHEAIVLHDAPRGYILLTYNGIALGFVKNLGNRANNLYPSEWRILSSHIPQSPPAIVS